MQGLANAEKKVELFTTQVAELEEEVRSRDMLLKEVRVEMVRSTDALKLASQIKQVPQYIPKVENPYMKIATFCTSSFTRCILLAPSGSSIYFNLSMYVNAVAVYLSGIDLTEKHLFT